MTHDSLESMSEAILAFARMSHGKGCHLEWHQLDAGGWLLKVVRRVFSTRHSGTLQRVYCESMGATGYEAAHSMLERMWRT